MTPSAGYRITTDASQLDLDVVHRALSEDSYWATGRPREVVERSFAASRVAVAVEVDSAATVGFARAVTDGHTHAFLCDVWVEPDHRGAGLGRSLVAALVDAPDLRDVRRWLLATVDAHGLYERFGFGPVARPEHLLERRGATP